MRCSLGMDHFRPRDGCAVPAIPTCSTTSLLVTSPPLLALPCPSSPLNLALHLATTLGSPTQQATHCLKDGKLGPSTLCAAPRRRYYTMYRVTEDSLCMFLICLLSYNTALRLAYMYINLLPWPRAGIEYQITTASAIEDPLSPHILCAPAGSQAVNTCQSASPLSILPFPFLSNSWCGLTVCTTLLILSPQFHKASPPPPLHHHHHPRHSAESAPLKNRHCCCHLTGLTSCTRSIHPGLFHQYLSVLHVPLCPSQRSFLNLSLAACNAL